jgi:serine/threonine-protein kinase RsbW
MAAVLNLHIKNSLEALQAAGESLSRWLTRCKAPQEVEHFARLALEEFVTNSIKYGYDDSNEHVIEVSLRLSVTELMVTFRDDGRPFDPVKAPEPDLDVPIEEREVGGLGIYLVRKMADKMTYAREGGKNQLVLHKKLPEQ